MAAPPSAGASAGLGDLFSLSGGAGLTAGYVAPKTVSGRSFLRLQTAREVFLALIAHVFKYY